MPEMKILRIDLSSATSTVDRLPAEVSEKFLGGRGLGVYLLYRYQRAGVDPLSPENTVIFTTGPAQGTNAPFGSKTMLTTKSPLTGIYLYSVASGSMGHNIKKAGYEALVLTGKAREPVYLVVKDSSVEFRPARHLWGRDTVESHDAILAEVGIAGATCANIGPAGEMGFKLACINTDGKKARTFGRGGPGAVLGSKNLKGIVVSGDGRLEIPDQAGFKAAKQQVYAKIRENAAWAEERRRYGTGGDILTLNELGIFPTRNWNTGYFPGAGRIAPTGAEKEWPRRAVPCAPFCPNPCSHIARIDRGPYQGATSEGPEYETIYVFGSDCGNDQFDAIVAAEEICDRAGLDTMSVGVAVGFAMECYERGLLGREDLGGLDLKFGNHGAMVEMVRMIAGGKGIGKLLGNGVREASAQIPGSGDFAIHMKGMEPGGYECRGAWGQALQFMLNSRGGCHHGYGLPARTEVANGTGTQLGKKGEMVRKLAIERILFDCGIMCTFARRVLDLKVLGNVLSSLTGRALEAEMTEIGFRVLTMERVFNVREGIRRTHDTLPPRLLKEPLPDGPNRGSVVPREELLDEGYHALGWDLASGIPLAETLRQVGLEELAGLDMDRARVS